MRLTLLTICIFLSSCSSLGVRTPDIASPYSPKMPGRRISDSVGSVPEWSNGLDAVFMYSYAFCILIIAACIAVLVWMPVPMLKKWALMGITFCAAVIGMGITFSIMKPYIPWIVFSGCAIGALIGVWYIVSHFKMLKEYVKVDNDDDLSPKTKALIEICQVQNQKTK